MNLCGLFRDNCDKEAAEHILTWDQAIFYHRSYLLLRGRALLSFRGSCTGIGLPSETTLEPDRRLSMICIQFWPAWFAQGIMETIVQYLEYLLLWLSSFTAEFCWKCFYGRRRTIVCMAAGLVDSSEGPEKSWYVSPLPGLICRHHGACAGPNETLFCSKERCQLIRLQRVL